MRQSKRYVYSVPRAKKNLTVAIQNEVDSARGGYRLTGIYIAHSTLVYAREAAVHDLIASVRKEATRD